MSGQAAALEPRPEPMRFDQHGRVAIVIPVFNGIEYTLECVESLRRLQGDPPMVVIVDDGSSDGTSELLAEHHPDVVVVPGTGELWWSGGMNAGCRTAIERGARRLVSFNNDGLATPNLLVALERLLEEQGGIVSAVATMVREDGSHRLITGGYWMSWKGGGPVFEFGEGATWVPNDRLVPCDWLPGSALMFDSALFEELGGFDERRFPQYRGDIDFTMRAREAGHPLHATHACAASNDFSQTGTSFHEKFTLRKFIQGLTSLRSNYNLRETLPFAWRHCPRRLLPRYLAVFYARYVYAALKTRIGFLRRAR